jgi:uncharacterized protein YndB with AHSA1/START domain
VTGSCDAFTTSVRIGASPAEVFPYLTDSARIVRWMGDWADLDPRVGGVLALDINGVPVRGEYMLIEPPRRVIFTWGVAGSDALPPGTTTVEIALHQDGDSTVVEVVHRGLPADELPKHEGGWAHFLARLAVAGSGADAGPDPWAAG